MKFEKVTEIYISYVKLKPAKKIDSGHLLNEAGTKLLKIDKKSLTIQERVHRSYLLLKIAEDLLKLAKDMAYTKKYDLSQLPKKFTYLAFELAYEYFDSKPNVQLIPYLTAVIDYEKYNYDQSQKNVFDAILKDSLNEGDSWLSKLNKKYF
jgi:hypothetical protein